MRREKRSLLFVFPSDPLFLLLIFLTASDLIIYKDKYKLIIQKKVDIWSLLINTGKLCLKLQTDCIINIDRAISKLKFYLRYPDLWIINFKRRIYIKLYTTFTFHFHFFIKIKIF